jgi:hypothetical protein
LPITTATIGARGSRRTSRPGREGIAVDAHDRTLLIDREWVPTRRAVRPIRRLTLRQTGDEQSSHRTRRSVSLS